MVSEVAICNAALDALSGSTLISLDDATKDGRLCKRNYPLARDYILAQHPWSFATARVTLPTDSDAPEFGFDFQYTLPADYLKMVAFNGQLQGLFTGLFGTFTGASSGFNFIGTEQVAFKRNGNKLLTDEDEGELVYIRQVTTTGSWDVTFSQAVIDRLAYLMAYPVTKNNTLVKAREDAAIESLRIAKSSDSQEDDEVQIDHSNLLNSRR